MALTSEQIRLAKEAKAAAQLDVIDVACAAYEERERDGALSRPEWRDAITEAVKAAVARMSRAFRDEAISLEGTTMKGAKGIRDSLRSAAQIVDGFAAGLPATPTTAAAPTEPAIPPELAQPDDDVTAFLRGEIETLPAQSAPPAQATPTGATLELLDHTPKASPMLPLIDADPVLGRMEWSDVVELAARLRDRPQISPSTIIDLADCGFRWLFAHSHIKSDDGRPSERPQWWNVGGNAFHAAVEQIELADPRSRIVDSGHLSLKFIWLKQFEAATKAATDTGWSTSSFVAAKRGLENGDWWRVSGEDMLRRYVRYHDADWRAKNTVKSVELDGRLSTFALLPIVGRLDMLTESQVDGSLTVVDFKSGANIPPTTFQLGVYGHMVADIQQRSGEPVDSVRGAYWDARNGAHEHEIEDLLTEHPQVEIMMRAHSAVTTIQAAAYMPRPSALPGGCGSCPYSKLCPASAA